MIAPILPGLIYGIWDPHGGDGTGDWLSLVDGDLPPDSVSLLAFRDRDAAQAAADRLMDKHEHFTGRRPFYLVDSLVPFPAHERTSFAGRN